MLKITLSIALGIMLAGIIETTGSILFISALFKNIGNAFQTQQQATTNRLTISQIKLPTIKEKSENAVIQARNETQKFKAQYKKPNECYNIENTTTRIKCANAFMNARKVFNEKKGQ